MSSRTGVSQNVRQRLDGDGYAAPTPRGRELNRAPNHDNPVDTRVFAGLWPATPTWAGTPAFVRSGSAEGTRGLT